MRVVVLKIVEVFFCVFVGHGELVSRPKRKRKWEEKTKQKQRKERKNER